MRIYVEDPREGIRCEIDVTPHTTVEEVLKELAASGYIESIENWTLLRGAVPLNPQNTLKSEGVEDGDTLQLIPVTIGGEAWNSL